MISSDFFNDFTLRVAVFIKEFHIFISDKKYEAYLFFFNNTLLAKLGFKHKDLFFTQMQRVASVYLTQNTPLKDENLSQIVSAFAPYFQPNSAHLDSLIELKFEELFLHLALSKNSLFLSFLKLSLIQVV